MRTFPMLRDELRTPYSSEVVVLNGTSSSGKTKIGRALRDIMQYPYLLMDIDDFIKMFPDRYQGSGDRATEGIGLVHGPETFGLRLGVFGERFLAGFHRAVAATLRQHNCVIVCHLILDRAWLMDCARLWRPYDPLFVRIHCRPEIAERRERERGDREIGFSRGHQGLVPTHGAYDLAIDTSDTSPCGCAAAIHSRLMKDQTPTAFRQLLRFRSCVQ